MSQQCDLLMNYKFADNIVIIREDTPSIDNIIEAQDKWYKANEMFLDIKKIVVYCREWYE